MLEEITPPEIAQNLQVVRVVKTYCGMALYCVVGPGFRKRKPDGTIFFVFVYIFSNSSQG